MPRTPSVDRPLRILLVTPAPPGSRKGNRITAESWGGLLRSLGHSVEIAESYRGQPCQVMIALHARKSARSIARYRTHHPTGPLVVVLTGTDLYGDLPTNRAAQRSLDLASRIVVLQPAAKQALQGSWRKKTSVLIQSAEPPRRRRRPDPRYFDLCVIGHLRSVKDPFRAALAARRLPASSKIRVLQIGSALSAAMESRARQEMARNPRYLWLGEKSHEQTLQLLTGCRAMVLTSVLEGGANVISEAIVADVPVIASRIPASVSLLGRHYPALFEPRDTGQLTELMHRVETEAGLLQQLRAQGARLKPQFLPATARRLWHELLRGLTAAPAQNG